MQSAIAWREHFKVDKSALKAFLKIYPDETAPDFEIRLLLWCFEEGFMSESEYVQWASEHFEVPVIRSDYFEIPPDEVFWESMKDLHAWSTSCFPITLWDDTLLVATVFPDQELKLSRRHRTVLARPRNLAHHARTLMNPPPKTAPIIVDAPAAAPAPPEKFVESTIVVPSISTVVQAAPEEKKPEAPPEKIGEDDFFARMQKAMGGAEEAVPAAESESSTSESAPEGLVMPDGLSLSSVDLERLNTMPNDIGHESFASMPMPAAEVEPALTLPTPDPEPVPVAAPAPAPVAVEEGPQIILAAPMPTSTNTVAPAAPASEAPAVNFAMVPSAEPDAEAPQRPKKPSAPPPEIAERDNGPSSLHGEKLGIKGRKLEAPVVTSYISPSMLGGTQTGISVSGVPGAGPKTISMSADIFRRKAIPVNSLQPTMLDQCKTIDELGAQALLQTCSIFETGMVMLFKDGKLVPWKWSDLLLSVKAEKPEVIDLKDNSIFKIVFRTAKPYHGYVVTNPVNQKFFNEFHRGVLPKHASILPIMVDNRMAGMILGFTNAKIDYRQSLRQMERLSSDVARHFKNLRGTLQQAS